MIYYYNCFTWNNHFSIYKKRILFFINKIKKIFLQRNVSRETFHIKTRTKIIVEVDVIIKVIIEALIDIIKIIQAEKIIKVIVKIIAKTIVAIKENVDTKLKNSQKTLG